jgi:hypothetical protein
VERTPLGPSPPHAAFVLTIHEGLLSIRATEASLPEILDTIGRRMHIEVVMQLPADQKITLAFDRLPLDAALKRLGRYVSIAAITQWGAEKGQGASSAKISSERSTLFYVINGDCPVAGVRAEAAGPRPKCLLSIPLAAGSGAAPSWVSWR